MKSHTQNFKLPTPPRKYKDKYIASLVGRYVYIKTTTGFEDNEKKGIIIPSVTFVNTKGIKKYSLMTLRSTANWHPCSFFFSAEDVVDIRVLNADTYKEDVSEKTTSYMDELWQLALKPKKVDKT